jgi:hypothetical protein
MFPRPIIHPSSRLRRQPAERGYSFTKRHSVSVVSSSPHRKGAGNGSWYTGWWGRPSPPFGGDDLPRAKKTVCLGAWARIETVCELPAEQTGRARIQGKIESTFATGTRGNAGVQPVRIRNPVRQKSSSRHSLLKILHIPLLLVCSRMCGLPYRIKIHQDAIEWRALRGGEATRFIVAVRARRRLREKGQTCKTAWQSTARGAQQR